jgi:integrase
MTMQRGTIYKHHGSWFVRYYDLRYENSKRTNKRVTKKLADINDEYKTKASVRLLADKILEPINSKSLSPESSMFMAEFIENHFLPAAVGRLRQSTIKDYTDIFNKHLKNKLQKVRLRDFKTVHGQRLLASITGVSHERLLRIRAVLSATFTWAAREGILDGVVTPMHATSVPGRPSHFKGAVYSINEIENILVQLMSEPVARTVVTVAAFSGLRLSELRGLQWSDFDGENIHVQRTVWRTHVGPTKTADAEAAVPVLPLLKRILEQHRKTVKDSSDIAYVFAGERRGQPLNLANLARRIIIPTITRCSVCRKTKSECEAEASHKFVLNTDIPSWRGWHAFRRGLASNLYALSVAPKLIQAILRHSDARTTMQYYIQTSEAESRAAIEKLESMFPLTDLASM